MGASNPLSIYALGYYSAANYNGKRDRVSYRCNSSYPHISPQQREIDLSPIPCSVRNYYTIVVSVSYTTPLVQLPLQRVSPMAASFLIIGGPPLSQFMHEVISPMYTLRSNVENGDPPTSILAMGVYYIGRVTQSTGYRVSQPSTNTSKFRAMAAILQPSKFKAMAVSIWPGRMIEKKEESPIGAYPLHQ